MTSLVDHLNGKVFLLVVRQIIPPGNNLAEDLRNLCRSLNVSQVKALGIFDATMLISNDKIVLGHGSDLAVHAEPVIRFFGLLPRHGKRGSSSIKERY